MEDITITNNPTTEGVANSNENMSKDGQPGHATDMEIVSEHDNMNNRIIPSGYMAGTVTDCDGIQAGKDNITEDPTTLTVNLKPLETPGVTDKT